jgi:hypothetical protein
MKTIILVRNDKTNNIFERSNSALAKTTAVVFKLLLCAPQPDRELAASVYHIDILTRNETNRTGTQDGVNWC